MLIGLSGLSRRGKRKKKKTKEKKSEEDRKHEVERETCWKAYREELNREMGWMDKIVFDYKHV